MDSMFANCISFNQPLDKWNVSKCYKFSSMFAYCRSFNQDLSMWKVMKVPTESVKSQTEAVSYNDMFNGCTSLKQSFENWDLPPCTRLCKYENMFNDCKNMKGLLPTWYQMP